MCHCSVTTCNHTLLSSSKVNKSSSNVLLINSNQSIIRSLLDNQMIQMIPFLKFELINVSSNRKRINEQETQNISDLGFLQCSIDRVVFTDSLLCYWLWMLQVKTSVRCSWTPDVDGSNAKTCSSIRLGSENLRRSWGIISFASQRNECWNVGVLVQRKRSVHSVRNQFQTTNNQFGPGDWKSNQFLFN